jgi:hypothetical protein
MVRQANQPPIEYRSPAVVTREPKLWVFVLLAVIHLFGIGCGFHVWDYLGQPGKDPAVQLRETGPVGIALGVILYVIFFKRTWHLTILASCVAFALGASAGLSAVAMHLIQFGWH